MPIYSEKLGLQQFFNITVWALLPVFGASNLFFGWIDLNCGPGNALDSPDFWVAVCPVTSIL